jgi:hypothetical protein
MRYGYNVEVEWTAGNGTVSYSIPGNPGIICRLELQLQEFV